ncbi:hypothetical protein LEN26_010241 [Aphanomyces euteiches]|nr:hypothetical protein AeMF1_018521 [Aphanomyces euteiches]KAH9122413.1 hypothetical protein LEN26_010241 [Aphanomyces euteiches]KAH9190599.1 hypothetical protein AeNC1_007416 [Aphanomyces euteiches]
MQCIAIAVLVLLNLAFIAGGSLAIYFGAAVRAGHWSDIFTAQGVSGANAATVTAIAFGVVVILIALSGFLGAMLKNRCLLMTYAIFVMFAMLLFIAIAVVGFVASNVAKKWADTKFPAEASENDVANGFNQAYCYAEGVRFCTSATAAEALAMFLPESTSSVVQILNAASIDASKVKGLVGLCHDVDSIAGGLSTKLPSRYATACSTCKDVAAKYGEYKPIYEWANEECPLTATSATWCVAFLTTQVRGNVYLGAPYQACRPAVLDLWKSYGSSVGIAGIVLTAISIVLMFFACHIRKKPDMDHHDGYHSAP